MSARLVDASWPEVEARGRVADAPTTLIVPLGATEQHGPHLPLGTDATIAVALAEAAAARAADAVVAPVLPYGSSGEHQDFAGTLSIGAAATELVLVELGRSATETFPRLLFVNAHGGNAVPLRAAVARLRDEGRDVRAWSPSFGGDPHAGRTETSLMLALEADTTLDRGRPDVRPQVRVGLAEAGNDAPLGELIDRLQADGVRAVSPNGVLGDPAGASAAEGRALLAAAVDDLLATLAPSVGCSLWTAYVHKEQPTVGGGGAR
ncbi:MAG TPA: mycofactocin biosynthesis peptidyl-dipeptidase MftE [Solirubrobacterales bacterium]|jgi:creatinine amidohydrolase|nr:mycofactocin biosynthesis peptidyl-dipeptidase MftE [Solirubrobacterales bacterium]